MPERARFHPLAMAQAELWLSSAEAEEAACKAGLMQDFEADRLVRLLNARRPFLDRHSAMMNDGTLAADGSAHMVHGSSQAVHAGLPAGGGSCSLLEELGLLPEQDQVHGNPEYLHAVGRCVLRVYVCARAWLSACVCPFVCVSVMFVRVCVCAWLSACVCPFVCVCHVCACVRGCRHVCVHLCVSRVRMCAWHMCICVSGFYHVCTLLRQHTALLRQHTAYTASASACYSSSTTITASCHLSSLKLSPFLELRV